MAAKPGRGSDQFMLRLPDGMRERIRKAAEDAGRSMNAEIVDRLDDSFSWPSIRDALSQERAYLERTVESLRSELEQAKENLANVDSRKERALLILERERLELEIASQKETQEYIDRRLAELLETSKDIKDQRSFLEKMRKELLGLAAERLALENDRDAIISEQTALIDRLRETNRDTMRVLVFVKNALEDASKGDSTKLNKFIAEWHEPQSGSDGDKD